MNNSGTMSNLVHLNLDGSKFFSVDDFMRSMAAFPSLRFLSLDGYFIEGGSLFAKELPHLPHLEVLILGSNNFNGTLPIEGFCNLKNLNELDLSGNMFEGNLPECFNTLSSLKFLDISSNRFTGRLSLSLIANLTSLQYVDFSDNKFEGRFSFSSFSNHTKLEVVNFINSNDMFEIDTEEPIGWIPLFQLKVLVLPNCNINRPKGSVLPGFLEKQHKLQLLDMSQNSMQGQFPNWLIKNNTMLEVLNLQNNLIHGSIMLSSTNLNIKLLDISGNLLTGVIPIHIQKFLPGITHLNLSRNSLDGVIPSSLGEMDELNTLDLSHNKLSGEVPIGLLANSSRWLSILKLSNNILHGEVLSGNLSLDIWNLYLDSNRFTGKLGNVTTMTLDLLDISNNFFTGLIPDWISNMSSISELALRNNSLEGSFPCGTTSFSFLDISENSFSGPIPSCLNTQRLEHLHLGSNRFTGSIPNSFRNLTGLLTLDISNNNLSGKIPKFLGELSNLRILLLGKNNLNGSIPKQLCQLTNVSLLDLSSNSLTGSIPGCLYNVTGPSYQAFMQEGSTLGTGATSYSYRGFLSRGLYNEEIQFFKILDEVLFTTKTLSLTYKGGILDIMSGLDLSCNKLTGDIPAVLGLMTQIRGLNLSHNLLTGSIPLKLSNLTNIESLDLSSNNLTGRVPPELAKLNSLSFFNVSYNNLSGGLPDMKAQFATFTKQSYEGNPLLCGPPLENNCTIESHVTRPSNEEGIDEEWYDIDMTSFYGSCGSTWFVFMLGFAVLLYVNPYWRRRWLYLVEECMHTCYFFLYDLARKSIYYALHQVELV
ncbi:cuscuta receptor 1-like [Bidens hawaiensis]|uniref:cuscuta receptor 1-like n=1 Tax=Bidens hawaiensis TaxID=980011 RepID=UPI00404AEC33